MERPAHVFLVEPSQAAGDYHSQPWLWSPLTHTSEAALSNDCQGLVAQSPASPTLGKAARRHVPQHLPQDSTES
jgi:hypothetical protein